MIFEGLSDSQQARVFQCPNCKETIDVSAQQCRFCATPIDHDAAEAAAEALSKVSHACSEANDLIDAAKVLPRLIRVFALPAMAMRWWMKFGCIKTNDLEYRGAKRAVALMGISQAVVLVVLLAAFCAVLVVVLR